MSQVCDTGIETLSLKLGNSGPALVHQIPKSHEEIQVTSTDWKLAKTKTKNATSYDTTILSSTFVDCQAFGRVLSFGRQNSCTPGHRKSVY